MTTSELYLILLVSSRKHWNIYWKKSFELHILLPSLGSSLFCWAPFCPLMHVLMLDSANSSPVGLLRPQIPSPEITRWKWHSDRTNLCHIRVGDRKVKTLIPMNNTLSLSDLQDVIKSLLNSSVALAHIVCILHYCCVTFDNLITLFD